MRYNHCMKFDKRVACLVALCLFVATSVGAADAAQVVTADSTDYGKPTTGVLRALIVNIGTPSLPARPRNEFTASVATAAQQINQLSRGLTTVQTEYFGRDILLNDVANLVMPNLTHGRQQCQNKLMFRRIDLSH